MLQFLVGDRLLTDSFEVAQHARQRLVGGGRFREGVHEENSRRHVAGPDGAPDRIGQALSAAHISKEA